MPGKRKIGPISVQQLVNLCYPSDNLEPEKQEIELLKTFPNGSTLWRSVNHYNQQYICMTSSSNYVQYILDMSDYEKVQVYSRPEFISICKKTNKRVAEMMKAFKEKQKHENRVNE